MGLTVTSPMSKAVFFTGNTLEDSIRDAEKAFGQHMNVLTEHGGYVPAPKDSFDYIGDPRLSEDGGVIALIELDPAKYESKAIKFNSPTH